MGDRTKIAWADATWCWLRGCTEESPGCHNCYARRLAARFSDGPTKGLPALWGHTFATRTKDGRGKWTGKVELIPEKLELPFRWKKPRRIFVNSTSDTFHPSVAFNQIARGFDVMRQRPQHTFMVLTKRAARMRELFETWQGGTLPNVWLGVTTEDQHSFDARVGDLIKTPAVVRFLSIEPMLEPIDLRFREMVFGPHCASAAPIGSFIHWVICGCESGPNARQMDLYWVRNIRDQCVAAGVPFFFKQAVVQGKLQETPMLDGKRWVEFPEAR